MILEKQPLLSIYVEVRVSYWAIVVYNFGKNVKIKASELWKKLSFKKYVGKNLMLINLVCVLNVSEIFWHQFFTYKVENSSKLPLVNSLTPDPVVISVFSGELCEVEATDCGCVHGTCSEDQGGACSCDLGWKGYMCTEKITTCHWEWNPCQNGTFVILGFSLQNADSLLLVFTQLEM
jgi:hypothetical protein